MENLKSPFSFFDLFVYLVPGLIFSFTVVWFFLLENGASKIVDFFSNTKDFKYIFFFLTLIVAYSLGHVVSSLGSLIFEKLLVKKYLGYPTKNLFSNEKNRKWPFKSYGNNYSPQFIEHFCKTLENYFGEFENQDKFMLCFTFVKENCPTTFGRLNTFISLYSFTFVKENCPTTFGRLNTFISLYNFSRNSAAALIVLSISLFLKSYFLYGIITLLLAFLFTFRYLKFFKLYSNEIFMTFYICNHKNNYDQKK